MVNCKYRSEIMHEKLLKELFHDTLTLFLRFKTCLKPEIQRTKLDWGRLRDFSNEELENVRLNFTRLTICA